MSVESIITENLDIWTSAIKTKSASGRGSSNKHELYGIKKLRELILELAIRGKLVPQDTSEDPTSQLLKTIELNKLKLIKDKKIRKPKALPAIEEAELPFPIPSSWSYVRLNSIGDWGAGSTPKRSISEYYGGEIPWFKSGELSADYIHTSEETVTERALEETSLRYNNIGDVLIAMYGATIGKTSILNVRGTTNQAVCACTPFEGVANTYLLLLLKAYKSRFIGMGAGGAQPNISREKIISTVVPLPPQIEQKRIVSKVEELMTLCDQLETQTEASIEAHQTLVKSLLETLTIAKDADELNESWQRISAHFDVLFTTEDSIDQLKQTILQLAVMGKLVKQDPNDEPASKLLERIAVEKEQLIKDKKIKKHKKPAPITEAEKPFDLPDSWEWTPFGTLIQSFANGLYKPSKYYTDDGCISLRMYNIQQGKIVFDDARRVEVTSEELETYKLEANDLLINRVNSKELVGKTAIIPEHSEDLLYESMNMRAKPFKSYLSSEYLNIFMMSAIATKEIASFAKEAIGQASINQGQVSSIPTPLPPFNEQKKICGMVDSLFAICDRLNNEILSSKEIKSNLADSLKLEELA